MTDNAIHSCCEIPAHTMQKPDFMARLASLPAWGVRALAVHRQRRELLKLSVQQLNDIGLSRAEVQREANRPFWDFAAK